MSRAQDPSNTLSISVHCKKCLECYKALCDGVGAVTPEQALDIGFDRSASHDFMQDARSRFKAWAVNIAALQGAHLQSSLDFRLKEATEIRQRIVKILATLNESLQEAYLIVNGTEPNERWDVGAISDSDDDNVSTPEDTTQTSDLEQLFTAIKTANSSLMKLSMVIRNSPARDDYLKAASRYHFDARYDIGHVKEKHGAAKRSSDWLLERLGKAITRRRQYLKYREEHHTKLSRDWGDEAAEEVVLEGLEAPPMATAKAFEDEKPEKTIALTKLTKATTYVENKTMVERDGIDLDQGSFGSQTSYEPTVVGEAVHKLSVPPPPIMAFEGVPFEFGEPFQCPYCYMEQTVKNKTAWKKHVFRDLKPYVCTFRECNLKMFRSRNEWFAHEIQNHRREWLCISCLDSFTDKEKFSEHLQSMHSSLVAGSQLEALLLQCEEPVDKIPASDCLLCDEWESNLLDPKQDSKRLFLNNGEIVEPCGTLLQFRRHLGRHMEQLALFALPMAEEDEMEDDSVGEGSDDDDDLFEDTDVAVDAKDNEIQIEDSDDDPLPESLKGAILGRVQELKLDNLDDLTDLIFDESRTECYPGDAVTVQRLPGVRVRGIVKERNRVSPTHPDGKWSLQYTVTLDELLVDVIVNDKSIVQVHRVFFTKQGLRSFIQKNVSRASSDSNYPWVVKPGAARLYSIGPLDRTLEEDRDSPKRNQGDESIDPYSEEFYFGVIYRSVVAGPYSLRQAFAEHPGISSHISYIREMIKELSPGEPWQEGFKDLIAEQDQQIEGTLRSDIERDYRLIIDIAISRGPTDVRNLLERYPMLLAKNDHYLYLRQAIDNLSASEKEMANEHLVQVLNLSIVVKNIPVAVKKMHFLNIVHGMALPSPKTLDFRYDSGIYKEWAIARFSTVEEAERAISALNGFEIQGRTLRVESMNTAVGTLGNPQSFDTGDSEQTIRTAKAEEDVLAGEEEESDEKISAMMKRIVADMDEEATQFLEMQATSDQQINNLTEDNEDIDSRSIFVGNVDYAASPEEIQAHFQSCGPINRVTIQLDKFTGHPKGYAYVEFTEPSVVAQALVLNESLFRGRNLKVVPKQTGLREVTTSETNASKVTVGRTINLEGFGGEIETRDGTKTTLKKLVDESRAGVVIFTYDKASTTGGITQAPLFRNSYTASTATGFSTYSLSTDSTTANPTVKENRNLPYPLLCDPELTLISAIGLKEMTHSALGGRTSQGVFIIDKSGKVLMAERGAHIDHIEILKIFDKRGATSAASPAAAQNAAALEDKELQDMGLVCSIDKRVFRFPMKTPCCEKTYCKGCITNELIEFNFICPGCQTEGVLIEDLKPDDETSAKIKVYLEETAGSSTTDALPNLSDRAIALITEHLLKPLQTREIPETFRSLVAECTKKLQDKKFLCLRDVEQYLLSHAAKSSMAPAEYFTFCWPTLTSGLQRTVEVLSVDELTRPHDRPYSSDYFLDLQEHIRPESQQIWESDEEEGSEVREVVWLDRVDVVAFCRALYRKCRDAGGEYEEISDEVRGLNTVLKHLKYEVEAPDSLLHRDRAILGPQLEPIIRDCDFTLKQLDGLLKKYERLSNAGSNARKVKLGSNDMDTLGSIRVKLVSHQTSLTAFLDRLQLHPSGKMEPKLDKRASALSADFVDPSNEDHTIPCLSCGARNTPDWIEHDESGHPICKNCGRVMKSKLPTDNPSDKILDVTRENPPSGADIVDQNTRQRIATATGAAIGTKASRFPENTSTILSQYDLDVDEQTAHPRDHRDTRYWKCPVPSCEYELRGFANKDARNQHAITHFNGPIVCGLCHPSISLAERSFTGVDVFKRHLGTHDANDSGRCYLCLKMFTDAVDFDEHLDDCVFQLLRKEPSIGVDRTTLAKLEKLREKSLEERGSLSESSPTKQHFGTPLSQQDTIQAAARSIVIHLLAIEPMTETELSLKLPPEIRLSTDELREASQKVASWEKITSYSIGKWHLKQNLYKELDVWNFSYKSTKDRQGAIDNAIKQYDEMELQIDAPEWDMLLPVTERGTGKVLSARHKSITPPQQEISSNQVREDEIIALASIYGEDFRERTPSVPGWKSFDIRIKSSNEQVWITLEVILPTAYPNAEPLLRIDDDDGLREEARKNLRNVANTKPKELMIATRGQPIIMEIVNACLDVLEEASREDEEQIMLKMHALAVAMEKQEQNASANTDTDADQIQLLNEEDDSLREAAASRLDGSEEEELPPHTSHSESASKLPQDAAQSTESASTFPGPPASVLIQRLPANTTENTLRSMVSWSGVFEYATLLSPMRFDKPGFRSALLRFKTFQGALEAKNRLDGTTNPDDSAWMIVRILSNEDVVDLSYDTLPEVAAP